MRSAENGNVPPQYFAKNEGLKGLKHKELMMSSGSVGKEYQDGEIIVRQGDIGDCMHVVQEGKVEVLRERDGNEIRLAELGEGEFFGEMAIVELESRTATVRALGTVRVLTVDKKNFLRRIQEDPSLAFRLVQTMSSRIRELDHEVMRLSDGKMNR